MGELQLAIVTPQGKAYAGAITQVMVPGELGGFTIMRDHAPLIAALAPGLVQVKSPAGNLQFAVGGGFLEVRMNKVVILAGWAEAAADAEQGAALLKAHRTPAKPATPAKPG